jgi:stage II sporulation protein R
MKRRSNRLLPLELALLLALAATAVWGAWSLGCQEDLSGRLIRLHVIANSDDAADQELKLQVRDRVLQEAEAVLAGAGSREEAERALTAALPRLEDAAAREIAAQGAVFGVTASLERTAFPTRDYGTFALPAGEYTALRIVIGEGRGRNWWCVVFPPLCTAAATDLEETAVSFGLEQDDVELMDAEEPAYVLRFRSLELWDMLRRWLGK